MNAFDKAFEALIKAEGGYTNNTKDRGNWTSGVIGKGVCKGTKYGISAMAYPNEDIKNLTKERAKEIYYRDYWQNIGLDKLDPGLAYQVFDAAVNQGTTKAIKILQQVAGTNPDGKLGSGTLSIISKMNQKTLAFRYIAQRVREYVKIDSFQTFGKGWMNRMASKIDEACEL